MMFDKASFAKLKEAVTAILPMMVVILIINFAVPGLTVESDGSKFGPVITSLLISIVPLILGTALFSIGVEKSIAKIGEIVGTTLTKRKSLIALFIVAFLMGLLATLAEPDLSVLASRISPSGPNWTLIVIAAIGVGVFLIIGILRIVSGKFIKYWLAIGYGLIFALGCLADKSFFSICFDCGGMTTGVVTVPFIIALGVRVSRALGGDSAEDDSFGFSGLCSMGTVLSCMIFALILRNSGVADIQTTIAEKFNVTDGTDEIMRVISTYPEMWALFLHNLLGSLKDVAISMGPIVVFFICFNFYAKIKGKELGKIWIGFAYTFIGLILFFLGAESGFMPVSMQFGKWFASHTDLLWVFFLVAFATGFISMLAEPAVAVLAEQVNEVSRGTISKISIIVVLCFATSLSLGLNVVRVYFDISLLYFVIPLFIIAIGLALITPNIYVGIAIDAAGVATGTMASCFFLPMFLGFTSVLYASDYGTHASLGEAIMSNGFGVVGIMSIMPIIAMECVGIAAVLKTKVAYLRAYRKAIEPDDSQIIHLPTYDEGAN